MLLEDKSHYFDVEVAKIVGVEGAVFIQNINHWILKNKANDKHFYDGCFWTYNSIEAFVKLFPYFTKRQIERIINNLVKDGFLIKGNYNQNPYDRTAWYTIDYSKFTISPNGEMHTRESCFTNNQTVKCITDNKTNNSSKEEYINNEKPLFDLIEQSPKQQKTKKEKPTKESEFTTFHFKKRLIELGANESHVDDWLKVRKNKKATNTETALNSFLNQCLNNNYPVSEAVKICVENDWKGFKYSWIKEEVEKNKNDNGKLVFK